MNHHPNRDLGEMDSSKDPVGENGISLRRNNKCTSKMKKYRLPDQSHRYQHLIHAPITPLLLLLILMAIVISEAWANYPEAASFNRREKRTSKSMNITRIERIPATRSHSLANNHTHEPREFEDPDPRDLDTHGDNLMPPLSQNINIRKKQKKDRSPTTGRKMRTNDNGTNDRRTSTVNQIEGVRYGENEADDSIKEPAFNKSSFMSAGKRAFSRSRSKNWNSSLFAEAADDNEEFGGGLDGGMMIFDNQAKRMNNTTLELGKPSESRRRTKRRLSQHQGEPKSDIISVRPGFGPEYRTNKRTRFEDSRSIWTDDTGSLKRNQTDNSSDPINYRRSSRSNNSNNNNNNNNQKNKNGDSLSRGQSLLPLSSETHGWHPKRGSVWERTHDSDNEIEPARFDHKPLVAHDLLNVHQQRSRMHPLGGKLSPENMFVSQPRHMDGDPTLVNVAGNGLLKPTMGLYEALGHHNQREPEPALVGPGGHHPFLVPPYNSQRMLTTPNWPDRPETSTENGRAPQSARLGRLGPLIDQEGTPPLGANNLMLGHPQVIMQDEHLDRSPYSPTSPSFESMLDAAKRQREAALAYERRRLEQELELGARQDEAQRQMELALAKQRREQEQSQAKALQEAEAAKLLREQQEKASREKDEGERKRAQAKANDDEQQNNNSNNNNGGENNSNNLDSDGPANNANENENNNNNNDANIGANDNEQQSGGEDRSPEEESPANGDNGLGDTDFTDLFPPGILTEAEIRDMRKQQQLQRQQPSQQQDQSQDSNQENNNNNNDSSEDTSAEGPETNENNSNMDASSGGGDETNDNNKKTSGDSEGATQPTNNKEPVPGQVKRLEQEHKPSHLDKVSTRLNSSQVEYAPNPGRKLERRSRSQESQFSKYNSKDGSSSVHQSQLDQHHDDKITNYFIDDRGPFSTASTPKIISRSDNPQVHFDESPSALTETSGSRTNAISPLSQSIVGSGDDSSY